MSKYEENQEKFVAITEEPVIMAALSRVIDSSEFYESQRSKQLLTYIVEQFLAGEAGQINGTTIAQDVLGAGADFDSATNPIVRVQAGRLRALLSKYYRRSGKNDDVIIYVEKGQYAPQFGARKDLRPIIKASSPPRTMSAQTIAKLAVASVASLIIFISVFYGINKSLKKSPQTMNSEQISEKYPSIAILPFNNLTNDPKNHVFEQGFQHQIGADLSRFGIVRVVFSNARYPQIIAEDKVIANYVLEGTILAMGEDIDLLVKLINLKSGETTSQHRITRKTHDNSYYNALAKISSVLSDQYVGQEGALIKDSLKDIKLEFDMKNHRHSNLKAFECLSLFHKFETDKSVENFNHAAGCLRYQVSQNPTDSSLLAALAWITVYGSPETGLTDYYPSNDDYSLSKALKLAEKAITLDPGNSQAYEFIALIQWRMGSKQAAIQSIQRSIQLNPASTGNLVNLGHFLSFTGDWENGLKATNEAISQNSNAPYWYFTPLFMRAVLDRNAGDAMVFAKKHNDVSGADGSAYMLIAASLSNDSQLIKKYIPIIKRYAAKHGDDPLYVTRRWVQSPEIIKALEAELKAVGIAVPTN